ncbi:hypothetical protein Tdes44962_MAKER05535 [Teratosphaeria destructans]|uniref:Uncharacterized protein n=1 Tax=Teratosphaeria destructans TaxID=418781 RepID=A0A9W7SJT9_9PEZI|nr:hypothetical protein Tdes44962_MAKER05535 [Teratosphaeria destructans]
MAEKRLFYLSKHLNAVNRLSFQRAYTGSSDSAKQITTRQEQAAFLRAADQKLLQDAHDALDAFLANTEKIRHYIDTIPDQFKLRNSPIPPYSCTTVRDRQQLRTASQRLHDAGENVRGHFSDLMEMEHPEIGEDRAEKEWREGIEKMSAEDLEKLWMGLKIQEDAGLQRLKASSKRLGDEIRNSQGLEMENPWMRAGGEAGWKVGSRRKGRRGRASSRPRGDGRGNGVGADGEAMRPASNGAPAPAPAKAPAKAPASAPAPAPAPTPAAHSARGLADLQAQLEATGFQIKT